jgi:transcriptional regulator with XRE-family HTH domain
VYGEPSHTAESFRGLLLRHRGRTGLTQRDLAASAGVSLRSVQDWEAGTNHPSAERLRALVAALLKAGGLSPGHETEEATALWAAVQRDSVRLRTPFDNVWISRLLAQRRTGTDLLESRHDTTATLLDGIGVERSAPDHRKDWGQAPDVLGFVGRQDELAVLHDWVLGDQSHLVAVLGMDWQDDPGRKTCPGYCSQVRARLMAQPSRRAACSPLFLNT